MERELKRGGADEMGKRLAIQLRWRENDTEAKGLTSRMER